MLTLLDNHVSTTLALYNLYNLFSNPRHFFDFKRICAYFHNKRGTQIVHPIKSSICKINSITNQTQMFGLKTLVSYARAGY